MRPISPQMHVIAAYPSYYASPLDEIQNACKAGHIKYFHDRVRYIFKLNGFIGIDHLLIGIEKDP